MPCRDVSSRWSDKGATPVLVTPPPRNSAYCTGGNGTGAYAQALRELAESSATVVVDLNRASVDYLQSICPEPSPPDFFLEHFERSGAAQIASLVAQALRDQQIGLAAYLE